MSYWTPHERRSDDDERQLHKLGYAQVLYREMGGFPNFAISFTIISILAGCLTSYYIAFSGAARSRSRGAGCSSAASASSSRSRWARSPRPTRRPAASTSGRRSSAARRGAGSPAGSTSSGRSRSPRRSTTARDLHDVAAEPLVPGAPEHAALDLVTFTRDHARAPADQPVRCRSWPC